MTQLATKAPEVTPVVHHKTPAGPHSHFLLGSAFDLQRDPLPFLSTLFQQYGDIVRTRLLSQPSYMVYHPDYIKRVLQDNNQNYDKNSYTLQVLKPFLGNGLATNDGASWLQQRRLIQPVFHRKRITTFGTLMTDATVTMLERWQGLTEHEMPLDIPAEMMRLTLRIVGQALFSIDLSDDTSLVGKAFMTVTKLISDYLFLPFPPLFVPTPRNRRLRAAIRTLDHLVYEIISQRRKPGTEREDLLSMLLLARDEETGQGMNDQQVRDEVVTFLFAGHETTANTLTWTWYVLSQHLHVEQRLHAELDTVLNGHLPTVEHLPALSYTRMVIEESMRLYPSVTFNIRHAIANDEIGGYHIPANSLIWMSPYVTHRHPAFWEQPEVFEPERFTAEGVASRPRFAYFPFGGGPHLYQLAFRVI